MWSTCLLGMCSEILFPGSLTNKSPWLSILVTWGVQGRLIWTGHLWEDMSAVTVSSIQAPNIWSGSSAHSPIASQGLALVHLQQLQRLGVGARAPSSEFGAKDKRTTMLLIVLSPSWVEIRRTQAPILIRVLHACVGTHGSPGHVCHWVGTPSLEEEAPWATIFPGWCG